MQVIDVLTKPLFWIMKFCYDLFRNYGMAIILFTLISKLILIPVSVWVHNNSIKLVKMQPKINRIKAKNFGNQDEIAEQQAKLYKSEKYNPLLSLIPLALQILLLMGLIHVIYHPLECLLQLDAATIAALIDRTAQLTGADPSVSAIQLSVIDAVQNPAFAESFSELGMNEAVESIRGLRMSFLSIPISLLPSAVGGFALLSPLAAGFSSWLLCFVQNRKNVLQSEQGAFNRYGTMVFSVGLSLYLGYFVPIGVALYWIFGNLFAIVQLLVLNCVINPKKHVDYAELEASREELAALENLTGGKKRFSFKKDPLAQREREDYKRFFSVSGKHLVFYSESQGFYKYFEGIISEFLKRTNLPIHYITSDPNDRIFELAKTTPQIKPYYIGPQKLITLFMKMDADVVVMTMSDLNNYHYKRSYVRNDIEYVYVFHYPLSTHMVLHTGALDHYDSVLCVGEFQFDEIRKTEELYNRPKKKLIACGYGQLEKLAESYRDMEKTQRSRPKVLLAPSWQADNILDTCIHSLLKELLGHGFDVVVRPHPEYVKRYKPRMDAIVAQYQDYEGDDLSFELDFTSNSSIFDSDVVITDWSGTAYEFSFVTLKPAIFIDTPPKIHNPEYTKLGIEPLELSLRNEMGLRVDPAAPEGLSDRIRDLISRSDEYEEKILSLREKYIANFGHSSQIGFRYLVYAIKAAQLKRRAASQKNTSKEGKKQ